MTDPAAEDEREELLRQEAEREAKRRRRDAISRRVVGWITAVALAFLLYDSAGALAEAARRGRPWGVHAVFATLAALGLLWLLGALIRGIRARRRSPR
ncbi:hypothetical protein [Thermomonospora catenispora]|uniref:hypothetical protein n=1 Tax=Thermomonospora catenispora TaxID=2493090 RepID=UPI00111DFC4D|nr:hypothetical protein [Thermomonospora catenispora]TNY35615.1 hypothetical protein EIO00_17555 [Thermomonospora catenispora]